MRCGGKSRGSSESTPCPAPRVNASPAVRKQGRSAQLIVLSGELADSFIGCLTSKVTACHRNQLSARGRERGASGLSQSHGAHNGERSLDAKQMLREKKTGRPFLVELPYVCLSRACLGKCLAVMSQGSITWHRKEEDAFFLPAGCRAACRLCPKAPPEKMAAFFEFSLCLSRACLGKKIALIYKWLKTTAFAYIRRHALAREALPHPVRLAPNHRKHTACKPRLAV